MTKIWLKCAVACTALLLPACSSEKNAPTPEASVETIRTATVDTVSEISEGNATDVYWGDTHLHTADSADAFAYGTRLGPEEALRFARGEQITSTSGVDAQLSRPLDFLVIADHAVGLGVTREIFKGNPALVSDPRIARWAEMMRAGGEQSALATRELIDGHASGTNPEIMGDMSVMGPIVRSVWQARGQASEDYNEPGVFTAFIGYEYTSVPGGNNMHRVVIFRDGTDKTNQIMPFSSAMSEDPEDLWAALAAYEESTGGRALAIPHNSNVSNGQMFALTDFEGNPIDTDYANQRARWEPLVEVTQIKGDSEAHPFLSPNDEFAAFGDTGWDLGNLNLAGLKTDDMLAGDYVREALKRGLALEAETGTNPFKLGMIGSTDSHTSLSTADSNNFFGKHTQMEPRAGRAAKVALERNGAVRFGWHYLASGYAAVWAKENTREALFDAMMRKEVYASTGPRIRLRFFGGWDFTQADADADDFADRGYARGVPMGGDLTGTPETTAPTFLIKALMDPEGANLDRVQVIKGWVEADGSLSEHVYDVAWDTARQLDDEGNIPPVGDTVDLSVPTWSNTIGAPELKTVWTDPDFDPSQAAFYYTRVIEIPTPRWPAYDAIRYGAELPEDTILKAQERAYSSPIWYTPAN